MTVDLEELRRLAEAARIDVDSWESEDHSGPWQMMRDQSAAILAMIDRIRELEKEVELLEEICLNHDSNQ